MLWPWPLVRLDGRLLCRPFRAVHYPFWNAQRERPLPRPPKHTIQCFLYSARTTATVVVQKQYSLYTAAHTLVGKESMENAQLSVCASLYSCSLWEECPCVAVVLSTTECSNGHSHNSTAFSHSVLPKGSTWWHSKRWADRNVESSSRTDAKAKMVSSFHSYFLFIFSLPERSLPWKRRRPGAKSYYIFSVAIWYSKMASMNVLLLVGAK